jgi:uncharacterized protein YebE (UPF0316 family)
MGDLAWYIPVLIFCARVVDVSIGTVRMIFVIAGWRYSAAALGFVEVVIWASAIGGLISYITEPITVLAFAGGFATGNLVGIAIESRLALGSRVVRVINRDAAIDLPGKLREAGYRCTRVAGEGRDGPVELAYAVIKRKSLPRVLALIQEHAPHAIVTVERAEYASGSAFAPATASRRSWLGLAGVRK